MDNHNVKLSNSEENVLDQNMSHSDN